MGPWLCMYNKRHKMYTAFNRIWTCGRPVIVESILAKMLSSEVQRRPWKRLTLQGFWWCGNLIARWRLIIISQGSFSEITSSINNYFIGRSLGLYYLWHRRIMENLNNLLTVISFTYIQSEEPIRMIVKAPPQRSFK